MLISSRELTRHSLPAKTASSKPLGVQYILGYRYLHLILYHWIQAGECQETFPHPKPVQNQVWDDWQDEENRRKHKSSFCFMLDISPIPLTPTRQEGQKTSW